MIIGRIEEIWTMCRDQFYPESYDVIRQIFHGKGDRVVIQQALRNSSDFHGYFDDKEGVNLDNHIYQAFGEYWNKVAESDNRGWEEHLKTACEYQNEIRSGFWLCNILLEVFIFLKIHIPILHRCTLDMDN